ncbi:MAG: hypothetical protein IJW92_04960 [Clostridia bacterium]|nr:hypothetical protein [Clostridia bacterium]
MSFSSLDLYILCLCLVVFVSLTALFVVLITSLVRFYLRLVRLGAEDDNIKSEYQRVRKKNPFLNALGFILTCVACCVLCIGFLFSLVITFGENNQDAQISTLRVVRSNSMSVRYEKNEYLFENNLEDQFRMFDLILTAGMPAEDELELYDVVVYERDEMLIIHRIVKIEEPNEKHPDERYYYLQGDANAGIDNKPVTYGQMRGIWNGFCIPNVGSFIMFMQSPAGFLCILLMLFAAITTPIVERKLENEKKARYTDLTGLNTEPLIPDPESVVEVYRNRPTEEESKKTISPAATLGDFLIKHAKRTEPVNIRVELTQEPKNAPKSGKNMPRGD